MTGILADVNIQGHVDYLFHLLTSDDWGEFWQALGSRYVTFRDIGLDAEAADSAVWQACQDQGFVLVTSNRNQRGVDSLEATIRSRLTAESLPVLTLADAERFRNDRQYADRTWRSKTGIKALSPEHRILRRPVPPCARYYRAMARKKFRTGWPGTYAGRTTTGV